MDPLDPLATLAWERVVFRLSKTMLLLNIAPPDGVFAMKHILVKMHQNVVSLK